MLRDELQGEVRTKLLHAEELLESQFQMLSEKLGERSANQEQLLKSEIANFKAEVKQDLDKHHKAIDQHLTDFLSRQNILIQNLTQQIDSYNRVSQAQAVELSAIKSKIKELLPMGPMLAETQSVLATQDERLTTVESLSKTTASRLDEVLEKLKKSFFIGGKFKS
jgi:Lon protease-like protein